MKYIISLSKNSDTTYDCELANEKIFDEIFLTFYDIIETFTKVLEENGEITEDDLLEIAIINADHNIGFQYIERKLKHE